MGLVIPPDLLSATPDGSAGRLSGRFVVEDGDGQAVAGLRIEQVIGRADPRDPGDSVDDPIPVVGRHWFPYRDSGNHCCSDLSTQCLNASHQVSSR
jgi:hypothetical protein